MSTKAVSIAKRALGTTIDLTMMAKKKQLEKALKSKPSEEYFNCKKKGHNVKDCQSPISKKKKPKASFEEAKRT